MRPGLVLAFALKAAAVAPAYADEQPRKDPALPGVEADYTIVKPAPEPSQEPQQHDATTFKAGNWDVTVSGYVWMQMGASSDRK